MRIPTVKITYPANKRAGYALINESDFDPKKHKLHGAKDEGRPAPDHASGPQTVTTGDAPTAADVLAMADGNFMAFKSAAKKILGDDTPAKKDEIVAALRAKADA